MRHIPVPGGVMAGRARIVFPIGMIGVSFVSACVALLNIGLRADCL